MRLIGSVSVAILLMVLCTRPMALALCGDGVIDIGEQCDDGNTEERGWCAADCGSVRGPTQLLYVVNEDVINIVDIHTQSILTTIPVPGVGGGVDESNLQIAPSRRIAAVRASTYLYNDEIVIMDIEAQTVISHIPLNFFGITKGPSAMAFSPDSTKLFVATDDDYLLMLDIASGSIERAIPTTAVCHDGDNDDSHNLDGVVISRDGDTAYAVAYDYRNNVIKVDIASGKAECLELGDPNLDEYPEGYYSTIALSSSKQDVFVNTEYSWRWLAKVNGRSGHFQYHDYVDGMNGFALVLAPDETKLFVIADAQLDLGGVSLLTVDPDTLTWTSAPASSLFQENYFYYMAITPDASTVFWAGPSRKFVAWTDVLTNSISSLSMTDDIGGIAFLQPHHQATLCPPNPLAACNDSFGAASLLVKERTPGKEKIIAQLKKGPSLQQLDFGDPSGSPRGTTAYSLCIYDSAGTLAGNLDVDKAGDYCGGARCWDWVSSAPPNGKGYSYNDISAGSSGVTKLRLRAGALGVSKIQIRASNDSAAGQTALPTGIAERLQGSAAATIQLINDNEQCFGSHLTRISQADGFQFKGRK